MDYAMSAEQENARYFLYGLCACPEPTEHEVSKADYDAAVKKWAQGCESINGFRGWTAKGEFRGRIEWARGGPKIEYLMPNGFTSDAYLDDEIPERREILTGTDKHTDEPISVWWTGERWVQVS